MPPFSISFVCLGNICRSPMAESVFQHLVEEAGLTDRFQIESAGAGGWYAGQPADPRAQAVAGAHGLTLASRARQFQRADFARLQAVIALDSSVADALRQLAPTAADRAKIHLLREYDPSLPARVANQTHLDVPDPYSGGPEGFEDAFQMIERSSRQLLQQLIPKV